MVKLGPGTFTVSATIELKSGVVLRGAGSDGAAKGGTTIVKTGGESVIAIGSGRDGPCYSGSMGAAVPLIADAMETQRMCWRWPRDSRQLRGARRLAELPCPGDLTATWLS